MVVECTGRNVEITPKLRALTDQRAARLERRLGGPADVRVILNHEKHRFRAEVIATHGRGRWIANEEKDDPRAALVQAFEKIEAQAIKESEKRRTRKHGGAAATAASVAKEPSRSPASGGNGNGRAPSIGRGSGAGAARIVRVGRKAGSAKPMTAEEAAMRIDGSREDFVVFRDSASEKISVLYKRRDGDFGLIVPEW
jgi:putative sigma-54 modulation protein